MPAIITRVVKILTVFLIPILLVLGSARLLATDTYLTFEYGKSSFPPDSYGFTSEQRFILASTNVHYVRAHLPSDELSKQTLNGVPVYNEREVMHMADVKAIFQAILRVWQVAFVLLLLLGIVLWESGERIAFASAIRSGGLFSSAIILVIAVLAIFAWQFWFNTFHLFFFQPGSWLFSDSDTLIRLFPVEFWFDATLTISVLSLIGGLIAVLLGHRLRIALQNPSQIAQIWFVHDSQKIPGAHDG